MAGIQILKLQHILVVSNFEAHITTARLCVCVYALKHFVNYGSAISKVGNATLHIGVSISNSTLHDGFLSTWDRINVMQALEYQLIN